jgi:hypothetical protein
MVFALLAAGVGEAAGESDGLSFVSDIFLKGLFNDAEMRGDYLFCTCGYGLLIMDMSDPGSPAVVCRVPTPGEASGFYLTDSYAFVADGGDGLAIIDITDVESAEIVAQVDTESWAENVQYVEERNIAYVANTVGGVALVGFVNPELAWLHSSFNSEGLAYDLVVRYPYVYIADGTHGVVIADVSSPSSPVEVFDLDIDGDALGLTEYGDYLIVAAGGAGVKIYDISDPDSLQFVSSFNTAGKAWECAVRGNALYVADGGNGLVSVDISDIHNPQTIGKHSTRLARAVAVSENNVVVADHDRGIKVFTEDYPSLGTFVSDYVPRISVEEVCVQDGYAYIAAGTEGLVVFDISDVKSPVPADTLDTEAAIWDIFAYGDYLFAAADEDGVMILDISDPYNLSVIGQSRANSINSVHPVAVFDTTAVRFKLFAGANYYGMYAFDVEIDTLLETALIESVSVIAPQYGTVLDLIVPGYYAYLANYGVVFHTDPYGGGLDIINVQDMNDLFIEGRFNTRECPGGAVPGCRDGATAVAKRGSFAYIAVGEDGVEVVNVRDVNDPYQVERLQTYGHAEDVFIDYDELYVADGLEGIMMVDASDPDILEVVTTVNTSGYAKGVTVLDSYVYVADNYSVSILSKDSTPVATPDLVAYEGNGGVFLSWRDVGYVSYNVYRKTVPGAREIRLNEEPIFSGHSFIDSAVRRGVTYLYTLGAIDESGVERRFGPVKVSVADRQFADIKTGVYPNPFNPEATISYAVPGDPGGAKLDVELNIFSPSGRLVRNLLSKPQSPGRYEIKWRGTDSNGNVVPSGTYFFRLEIGDRVQTGKLVNLK